MSAENPNAAFHARNNKAIEEGRILDGSELWDGASAYAREEWDLDKRHIQEKIDWMKKRKDEREEDVETMMTRQTNERYDMYDRWKKEGYDRWKKEG